MLSSLQLQGGREIRKARSDETQDVLIGKLAGESCLQSGSGGWDAENRK